MKDEAWVLAHATQLRELYWWAEDAYQQLKAGRDIDPEHLDYFENIMEGLSE